MPNVKVGDDIVHNEIFRLSVLSVLDGNGILQQSQFYFIVSSALLLIHLQIDIHFH